MSAAKTEERVSLYEFMPYGAPELMEVARRYMFRATWIGTGSIVAVFVLMFVTNLIIAAQQKAIPVVQMQVSDLAAPPPLSQDTPPPQVQVAPAIAPPAAATASRSWWRRPRTTRRSSASSCTRTSCRS